MKYDAGQIIELLNSHRFNFASEKELQLLIQQLFEKHTIQFEREKILGKSGTIDFFFPDTHIGLEIKIKQSPAQVLRQLMRYTENPDVHSLILLTSKNKHDKLIPSVLNGKNVHVVSLWRTQL